MVFTFLVPTYPCCPGKRGTVNGKPVKREQCRSNTWRRGPGGEPADPSSSGTRILNGIHSSSSSVINLTMVWCRPTIALILPLPHYTNTTINFTRYSVTELVPYLRLAGHGLRVVNACYGGKWAWLTGRGHCMASRPEWQARHNGSVHLDWGRSSPFNGLFPGKPG